MLMRHSDTKAQHCTLCEYASARACEMRKHMMTHTEERLAHNDAKAHQCMLCGYAGNLISHLRKHMKTHTVEMTSHECNT